MSDRGELLGGVHVGGDSPIKKVNVLEEDFGLDIPIESVPLPSMGLIYPIDSPLYGKETLEIRPMTAKEEDILTSRALIKKGTVLTELMKSCLVDKNIDPDMLISGDRNALMIALRITGYGAEYKVDTDCPACGTTASNAFDLSDLAIKRLEIDPVAEGANLFEIQLPVTKKTLQVKFLTGQDEQDIVVMSDRKKKQGLQKTDTVITDRLSRSIISVEGIRDKNKIGIFVRNMPARDSLTLRKFLDAYEPGIEMKSWMTCPSCHEQSEVRLPLGASFFWPET